MWYARASAGRYEEEFNRVGLVRPRFSKSIMLRLACIGLDLVLFLSCSAKADPDVHLESTEHHINNIRLGRSNFGTFGGGGGETARDPFTGELLGIGSEFPIQSRLMYNQFCLLMVGAIVDGDTLVSEAFTNGGQEFSPDVPPLGDFVRRSTLDTNANSAMKAVSQEDIIAVYTDTFLTNRASWVGRDEYSRRPHIPLGIEITDRSYAWSYGYAEDFILFNLSIKNIGHNLLQKAYFGILVVPYVTQSGAAGPYWDDVCGFLKRSWSPVACQSLDTVDIAWYADNDGDPVNGKFQDTYIPYRSVPHVAGLKFLGSPPVSNGESPTLSFNWFAIPQTNDPVWDFGPRRRENYRDFGTGGLGDPIGDRNTYYVLSSGEIDYDMVYTSSISPNDLTWMYPPQEIADNISDGVLPVFIFSIGPFELPPGGVLPIAFAYLCGEDLHKVPYNLTYLPDNPSTYTDNLDFSDLVKNATWAEWIYDNPGVDTDSDGYAGEFKVCVKDSVFQDGQWIPSVAETTWVKGDGIPDWKAAGPPPAPVFWVRPVEHGIYVRFNGRRSETEKDVFSRIVDFEGYRIYLGRDNRREGMSIVASYDRQDYDQWVFRQDLDTAGAWQIQSVPFTLDSLRCLYGRPPEPCNDISFDPLSTTVYSPYHDPEFPDSLFYFTPHEYNASEFGVTTPITKIYPDEPDPSAYPPDSIPDDAYTDDGYLKYYEYEFTIENLLPTVPYWVNVTAFDFGSPKGHLDALETSNTLGAEKVYPLTEKGLAPDTGKLNVYVYPNPYRTDAGYRSHGYEGRTREDRPDNRVREINFENLPPRCTISIYSLDGDLVRSIDHDVPESDPNYHHDAWDMITRNTQEPVSGLYYWVVEASDGRTQIGKLVLIM